MVFLREQSEMQKKNQIDGSFVDFRMSLNI